MFGSRERLGILATRGFVGAGGMTTYYFALMLLPLADAVTVFFCNPPLTAILAWLIL